jgi:hypothetical protein
MSDCATVFSVSAAWFFPLASPDSTRCVAFCCTWLESSCAFCFVCSTTFPPCAVLCPTFCPPVRVWSCVVVVAVPLAVLDCGLRPDVD